MNDKQTDESTTRPDAPTGPPPYNPEAITRVIKRVQIRDIQLLGLVFQRRDDSPLPQHEPEATPDELGVGVEWALSDSGSELGCALTFAAQFEHEAPYELIARFGATYSVADGPTLLPDDLEQFAHWNAVFNAWPYWRELAATTIARTDFARLVVPLMPIPREHHPETEAEK